MYDIWCKFLDINANIMFYMAMAGWAFYPLWTLSVVLS